MILNKTNLNHSFFEELFGMNCKFSWNNSSLYFLRDIKPRVLATNYFVDNVSLCRFPRLQTNVRFIKSEQWGCPLLDTKQRTISMISNNASITLLLSAKQNLFKYAIHYFGWVYSPIRINLEGKDELDYVYQCTVYHL